MRGKSKCPLRPLCQRLHSFWSPPCRCPKQQCSTDDVPCPVLNGTRVIEQPARLPLLANKYTRGAVEFIRESANSKKPFFLYFAFHHPHHPQFAGKEYQGRKKKRNFVPGICGYSAKS